MKNKHLLQQVLNAKDDYYRFKRGCLAEINAGGIGDSLIVVSLNVPGFPKRSQAADELFDRFMQEVQRQCDARLLLVLRNIANNYGFLSCELTATEAKRHCVYLESSNPIYRLLDADCFSKHGETISRTDLGEPKRRCLLCGRDCQDCIVSRRHKIEDVRAKYEEYLAMCSLLSLHQAQM